jgi:hypothetical protein
MVLAGIGAYLLMIVSPTHAQTTTTNCTTFGNQLNCTHNTLAQPQDNSLIQLGAASLQAMALQRAAEAQAAWASAGRQAEQAADVARERADQTAGAIPALMQRCSLAARSKVA